MLQTSWMKKKVEGLKSEGILSIHLHRSTMELYLCNQEEVSLYVFTLSNCENK